MSFRSRNRHFCKFKEIKVLRGSLPVCAAQAIPPTCPPSARLVRLRRDLSAFGAIDAEIVGKGHLWMETK
jgi:hypothetical protein